MKENPQKPNKYYVVFAVCKPEAKDMDKIKAKLGDKATKYPTELCAKINLLVHNVEDESFALFVCHTLSDQEKHSHIHYTEQGKCLHEELVDDCATCKEVIMKKFGQKVASKYGKKLVEWEEVDNVGVVYAKDDDNINTTGNPENN